MTEILMVLPDGTAEHGTEPLLRSRLKTGDWITATGQGGEPVQGEVAALGQYKVQIDVDDVGIRKVYWWNIQAANMSQRDAAPGVCRKCGCTHEAPCIAPSGPCAWANVDETLCTFCDDRGVVTDG